MPNIKKPVELKKLEGRLQKILEPRGKGGELYGIC